MRNFPQVAYDSTGRLSTDVLCTRCGHNLRGLPGAAVCTECGTPLAWTLRGHPLHVADPDWLWRVRSGVALVACLVPWIWFPPAWLPLGLGLWRLLAPTPRPRDTLEFIVHDGLRPVYSWGLVFATGTTLLAVLFYDYLPAAITNVLSREQFTHMFMPALALLVALVGWRLWRLGRAAGARRLSIPGASATACGLFAAAAWGGQGLAALLSAPGAPSPLLKDALIASAVALLPGLVLAGVALPIGWRTLQVAEAQARGLRTELKAWQGATPGQGWKTAPAPAPAAPAPPAASTAGAAPATPRAPA